MWTSFSDTGTHRDNRGAQFDTAVFDMTEWDNWLTIELPGGGAIELPAVAVAPRAGVGIDSTAREFTAAGLSVLVDQGPFASVPVGHESAPGYTERVVLIDGLTAVVITYPVSDSEVLAVRIPELDNLTVVVRHRDPVPPDVAERIVFSIHR
jgi:hypothetical protein